MHELGVMIHVVQTVERFAQQNGVTQIDTLVLQIGEAASVVPQFIQACYPAAVDGTLLQNTRLKIEITPANALCQGCRKVYHLPEHRVCPQCGAPEREILSGREFMIKEIVAC